MLISTAYAADPAPAVPANTGEPSPLGTMFPLVLVCIVFYLFMIRPQQKKIRTHEAMIKGLRRGDKVVTGGGVIGTIYKLDGDDILVIEVAPDVRIRVLRETISEVVNKTIANDNNTSESKDSA